MCVSCVINPACFVFCLLQTVHRFLTGHTLRVLEKQNLRNTVRNIIVVLYVLCFIHHLIKVLNYVLTNHSTEKQGAFQTQNIGSAVEGRKDEK